MTGQQTELLGDVPIDAQRLDRKTTLKEDRSFSFDYSFWSAEPKVHVMANNLLLGADAPLDLASQPCWPPRLVP